MMTISVTESQAQEAAKIIQAAYRTYKYYQQILNMERLEPGAWIKSNYESLKAIRDDYFCRFFMVRLVGFFNNSEIRPYEKVLSPNYERMNIYTLQPSQLLPAQIPADQDYAIVNASRVVEEKIKFFSQQDITVHPITSTDPYTCLYYLSSPPAALSKPLQNDISPGRTLDIYPSLYQVQKFEFPASAASMIQCTLPEIKQSPAFKKIFQLKNKHPIYKFLADTIEHLPVFKKQDAFMSQLLEKIIAHLNVIAFYDNHVRHYYRISQLYILTMSFVFVALAYEAPYSVNDYRRALDQKQQSRLSLHPNIKLSHYPTKSLVDALMTSLMAEQQLSNGCPLEFIGITDFIDSEYAAPAWHEARTLILEMQKSPHSLLNRKRASSEGVGASRMFITGITSEHQLQHFKTSANFQQAISRIKEACQHVTSNDYISLIIDETIAYEAEEDPCVQLIKALENELLSGSLNMMMCKSFQKFSSLGTSKVKFGNLTIINNAAPKFTAISAYFDANLDTSVRETSDELQMVTHHLKYNVANEILLVQKIRKQVQWLKTHAFRDRQDIISSDLFLHDVKQVETTRFPLVDNYGFLFSSKVSIGRWSLGLEPREMLSRFFLDFIYFVADYSELTPVNIDLSDDDEIADEANLFLTPTHEYLSHPSTSSVPARSSPPSFFQSVALTDTKEPFSCLRNDFGH